MLRVYEHSGMFYKRMCPMMNVWIRKFGFVAAVVAIPVVGASSASAFPGGSVAPAVADTERAPAIIPAQSLLQRFQARNDRFSALRAALAGRSNPARVSVRPSGRRFSNLAQSLRCRRNPSAIGCGLVSPSRR